MEESLEDEVVEKYLKVLAKIFLEATNALSDLYAKQPTGAILSDDFSIVVLEIYQNFMLDLMPSAKMLVDQHKFYSFSILCRSAYDIIIQLRWILSLKGVEQDKAIKSFLNFEGVGVHKKNGKDCYEWYHEIDPEYTAKGMAIKLGIDQEFIDLPLTNHSQRKKLKLTEFDYLSKITHWNPRLIQDLVGIDNNCLSNRVQGYLVMATLSSRRFVYCAITFTEIFMERFHGVANELIKQKIQAINEKFQQSLKEFVRKTLSELAPDFQAKRNEN